MINISAEINAVINMQDKNYSLCKIQLRTLWTYNIILFDIIIRSFFNKPSNVHTVFVSKISGQHIFQYKHTRKFSFYAFLTLKLIAAMLFCLFVNLICSSKICLENPLSIILPMWSSLSVSHSSCCLLSYIFFFFFCPKINAIQ